MFAFHQADGVSHHSKCDEIVAPLSLHDYPENLSRRLTKRLDCSQHVAIIQGLIFRQHAFIAGLIDVESKYLAAKPVLHNHACSRSSRGIRPKIICLNDPRTQTSKAEQADCCSRDQREDLNRE